MPRSLPQSTLGTMSRHNCYVSSICCIFSFSSGGSCASAPAMTSSVHEHPSSRGSESVRISARDIACAVALRSAAFAKTGRPKFRSAPLAPLRGLAHSERSGYGALDKHMPQLQYTGINVWHELRWHSVHVPVLSYLLHLPGSRGTLSNALESRCDPSPPSLHEPTHVHRMSDAVALWRRFTAPQRHSV